MHRVTWQIAMFILGISILGLTGCSTAGGYVGHAIQTQVQLNQANFDVIKSVEGEASANYFFNIGPSKQNIMAHAKSDMIRQANLQGPQALINVTTDIKSTGFLIWSQRKAYVSAEVIEFR